MCCIGKSINWRRKMGRSSRVFIPSRPGIGVLCILCAPPSNHGRAWWLSCGSRRQTWLSKREHRGSVQSQWQGTVGNRDPFPLQPSGPWQSSHSLPGLIHLSHSCVPWVFSPLPCSIQMESLGKRKRQKWGKKTLDPTSNIAVLTVSLLFLPCPKLICLYKQNLKYNWVEKTSFSFWVSHWTKHMSSFQNPQMNLPEVHWGLKGKFQTLIFHLSSLLGLL